MGSEPASIERLRAPGTLWVFHDTERDTEARSGLDLSPPVGRCHPRPPARQLFPHLPVRGNADWTPQRLTWISVLLGWDEGQTLAARWEHAGRVAREFHPHWRLGTSYSGFTRAAVRQTPALAEALKRRLRRQMRESAGARWRRGRWPAFAVDGTRIEAPHTAANEADLGCAGRDKAAPQVFLTALWHMGMGLPWDYRVGPGTDSERTHMEQMAGDLPPGSLVVADAGFVGYGLCLRLLRRGHHFLLRVGGNITPLRALGYYHEERDGLVDLWPQRRRRCRPLVLRLIVLRHGKQDVYLLTDALAPGSLGDAEAAGLFGMRWGEEVFFRSYKQTLGRRRLLSRTAATCLLEAQWTLLSLWLLGLLSVSRLVSEGIDPLAFRRPRRETACGTPCGAAGPGAAPGAWRPPWAPPRRTTTGARGARRPATTRGRSGRSRPGRRRSNRPPRRKSRKPGSFHRRISRYGGRRSMPPPHPTTIERLTMD